MLSNLRKSEFWLAILVGVTLAVGFAPSAYWIYFDYIGWPHPYITHNGPLWGTLYGDLLCWGNFALLCAFPLLTLPLAVKRLSAQRTLFSYLCLALPLAQIFGGLLNLVFLVMLLD